MDNIWEYDDHTYSLILKKDWKKKRGLKGKVSGLGPLFLLFSPVIFLCMLIVEAHSSMYAGGTILREIRINGIRYISREEVEKVVDNYRGRNFLDISAAEVRERLTVIPGIDDVVVEKEFPDRLRIYVFEKDPVMGILNGDRVIYIDSSGARFPLAREKDVPVIEGISDGREISGVIDSILFFIRESKKNGISRFLKYTVINVSSFPEILVDTEEHIRLVLDTRRDLARDMRRLRLVLEDLRKNGIIIERIDLRFEDIYVKYRWLPRG